MIAPVFSQVSKIKTSAQVSLSFRSAENMVILSGNTLTSSYLLEPPNPMANREMRFYGYIATLTKPLGYSSPSSCQLGHMTTLFTSLFLLAIYSMDVFRN